MVRNTSEMVLATNVGTWSLIIGIAALILSIPMAVFANMVSPAILNWFAQWSDASLRRRITKLETELAKRESECPIISETDDHLLKGVICVVKFTLFGFEVVGILGLWIGIRGTGGVLSTDLRIFLFLTGATCLFLVWIWRRGVAKRLYAYQVNHSPRIRANLIKSINELKEIRDK